MARFYTSVSNSRGNTTTAQGQKQGQHCHIRGWNGGVKIGACPSPIDTEKDCFELRATGGSNDEMTKFFIGVVDHEGNFSPSKNTIDLVKQMIQEGQV